MLFELEQGTGECRVGADGLYWVIDAVYARSGPDAPRLYCDGRSLGPFCRRTANGACRRASRTGPCPSRPQSVFTLSPRPGLVPYVPPSPSLKSKILPELIPIQFNGKLYLKQTQPVP